ncbi:hypothetical protein N665_0017s0069 [Sinapis alba]|nr:hypothetical protein N665_0017s0069 [Sinapis alba]
MNNIVRTLQTRKPTTSPIHLLLTNSAHRINNSKKQSTRNTVIMTIDVNDTRKAKTVLMDHEITLNTHVRASITLEATSITCKRKESWKEGELVIMSFQIHNRLRWRIHNTMPIQCEITRRTMIQQFFINLSSAKTTFSIRIVWWSTGEELKRMQGVIRVVYLWLVI